MSGKQKRAARKAAESGLGDNRLLLRSMSRRDAVKRMLSAVLALSGLETGRHDGPYGQDAKPAYRLDLVFLDHNDIPEAVRFLKQIDAASEKGDPVDLVLIESEGLKESAYRDFVVSTNRAMPGVRKDYLSLLRSGYTAAQAEEEWHSKLLQVTHTDTFSGRMATGLAVRGLPSIPIEAYGEEDYNAYVDAARDSMNRAARRTAELMASNAPLRDLMQVQLQYYNGANKYLDFRNRNVVTNLERRLDNAQSFFPELGSKLSSSHELRVMGFMGLAHNPVYHAIEQSSPRFRVQMEEYVDEYNIKDRICAARHELVDYDARVAFCLTIDVLFNNDLRALSVSKPEEARKFVSNTLALTLPQFEWLDLASSRAKGLDERKAFILDRITANSVPGV